MKNILLLVLLTLCINVCFSQKLILGTDFGFQQGKYQFFEAGINLGLQTEGKFFYDLSIGIEDEINSKLLGYKLGLSATNSKVNSIPIAIGLNVIKYNIIDQNFNSFRPEIGLASTVRHGRGRTIVKLMYGYNITESKFENEVNSHLLRFSLNSDWRSFLRLITFNRL